MLKLSSTAIQRFAHQLSPKVPRFDCALMPPFACRVGGKENARGAAREALEGPAPLVARQAAVKQR